MKYYIIAGEASGDLHGSNLVKELNTLDPKAEYKFWGGDLMQKQTREKPTKHYRELAFMGFLEVIQNIGTILGNLSFCKKDIKEYAPDAVILIDYPGFNLRIAEFTHNLGIKVVYYISPQVWAWKASRVKKIKKYVDQMLVILPFEKEFYQRYKYEVEYVGHPLLDEIQMQEPQSKENLKQKLNLPNKPIVALLPGSRDQEIRTMLPMMQSMVEDFPDHQFVVAGAPSKTDADYKLLLDEDVILVKNKTYDVLNSAEVALVASGTATLETAILGIPQVVCYKGSWLSYQIGKRLVKNISFISLANLIMNREIVTELIQNDFNKTRLKEELSKILSGEKRAQQLLDYKELSKILGGGGASKKTAESIINLLKK